MLVFSNNSTPPRFTASTPVVVNKHTRPVRFSALHGRRRCVYRQYEQLVAYEQVLYGMALLADWEGRAPQSSSLAVQAWQWQKELVTASCSSSAPDSDTLLLLQHPSVYTLGAGSTTAHLHFDPESPPHPLHRTERGGEVTYHGPGQLVMYPIMNLKLHTADLHWYLRSLEEVVIR